MTLIPTFVDLETFYSTEYSLTRLPTAAYILDPRFELICASIRDPTHPTQCYWGEDAERKLLSMDWENRCLIAHHARFDGAVLAWRYGCYPKFYACTMSMAEIMVAPFAGGASLAKVTRWLGTPPKGDEVSRARGKRRADFSPEEAYAYCMYSNNDNQRAEDIFRILAPGFPHAEFEQVDNLIRMFIQPQLRLNLETLLQYQAETEQDKANLLETAGLTNRADLMSQEKFCEMLRELGVEPPMKVSPSDPTRLIPALAKTDEEFVDLLDDEDEDVANLVAARLGHKSTIEQTRTQRLIDMAMLTPEHILPVPLRYGAAITHRPGGTDKINLTNLSRVHPKDRAEDKPRPGPLRDAIEAPPGCKVVSIDASQIELRLLMWQARQMEMLQLFEEGRSAYIEFSQHLYGRKVSKAEKEPYTLSKVCVLSCGYAVGPPKFKRAARAQSSGLLRLTIEQADHAVRTYRRTNYRVPELWRHYDTWISAMAEGRTFAHQIDGHTIWEIHPQALKGPGDVFMVYPALRRDLTDPTQFVYDYKRTKNKRLYGAKVVENTCQHLTRCIMRDATRRIKARTGYRPALEVYDELVYVVPDQYVSWFAPIAHEEVARRPVWGPGLPTAAEASVGQRYGSVERII